VCVFLFPLPFSGVGRIDMHFIKPLACIWWRRNIYNDRGLVVDAHWVAQVTITISSPSKRG